LKILTFSLFNTEKSPAKSRGLCLQSARRHLCRRYYPLPLFFSSTHNMYQINSKCTNRNICSYFPRYKFHSGNQKKNRKVCQNQRCCVTPYIVIYSVLAMNIEISLRYLKHAAGILYFHPKQPESSSCAGIPAGTSILSG